MGPFFPQVTVTEARIVKPIELLSQARVGQPVSIGLVANGANTCYEADRVDVQVNEPAKLVRLKAYVREVMHAGAGCGLSIVDVQLNGSFTPRSTGTYRVVADGWEPATSSPVTRIAEVVVIE
jgi:hypothetical protein